MVMPLLPSSTGNDEAESGIERQRDLRRDAQRRRSHENSSAREDMRKQNTYARRLSRSGLATQNHREDTKYRADVTTPSLKSDG
jgi:hypothetical protein